MKPIQRNRRAQFASWVGIIGNLILAVMKGIAGWISGSQALIADAAHSASDVVSSITVLAGISAANKPPDKEHPYGHGKAESISTIIVSILLILVGVEIARASLQAFWGEPPQVPTGIALIAVTISILCKELMYQYKNRLGKQIKSPALIADAWHHRSDVLSSIGVFFGVGGAMLGEQIGFAQLVYLDPLAGLIVALLIMRIGYQMINGSIHMVLENVLDEVESKRFIETTQNVPGVMQVDGLRARTHGQYVVVDLRISVEGTLDVETGHRIAKRVKRALMSEHDDVQDVIVHINPYSSSKKDNPSL